jgi:predicted ATPase
MLRRVVLKDYRSIASCDVQLEQLTFLVGLNGAGKSNFIDALRFCRDALRNPLEQAFASRASNLQTISHWDASGQPGFGLRLELALPALIKTHSDGHEFTPAHYSFWIGAHSPRGFEVRDEECAVGNVETDVICGRLHRQAIEFSYFRVRSGVVSQVSPGMSILELSTAPLNIGANGRLYLPTASGVSDFREVHSTLIDMQFYSPDPEAMKVDLDTSGPADILEPDGSNIASVFQRISVENPEAASRVIDYMRRIVPGLRNITAEAFRTYKLLNFELESPESGSHTLLASSMSDGTLRAFAVLVALFQRSGGGSRPTVVAIEEPETGLHPAAAGILFDALREGSTLGQVIVSSHSPDLLDSADIPTESILAVDASSGTTEIAPLDEAGRSSLHDRLYTAGELLRMDQLKPRRTVEAEGAVAELFTVD